MTSISRESVRTRERLGSAGGEEYLVYGRVAEEVELCLAAGRPPDLEAIVARHPEYERQIRELVPALVTLEQLGGPPANPSPAPSNHSDHSAGVDRSPSASIAGQLGDFRIFREIGRGGMGVVYEAEQISLGRRVAMKVLPFAAVMDPKQLQRFKNEAMAAAQLDHPNIVHVHYVGCERGVHFYAMQFIDGQTLAEVIRELRRSAGLDGKIEDGGSRIEDGATGEGSALPQSSVLDPQSSTRPVAVLSTERSTRPTDFCRTVARLGIQAAEALDHAHQVGIFHRDIKPSNLILDARGNLWITDFGLARLPTDASLTLTGDILGTLRYMSPEQALAKRVIVDHRTDVYSLGVTLYELLTLRPVFSGQDRQEILRQIAFDEPQPPRKTNASIPVELETIVLKAMAKNPAERYATAQELADDLRRHLEDKAILARRPGPIRRLVKWSLRHKPMVWSAAAATAAAFAVLAASIGWIMSDRDWRQKATEPEVTRALQEAEQLMSRASWLEAKTAVSRADGLLVTGRANEELRQSVQQLHADLQMVERLEEVREADAAMLDGVHDYALLDRHYEKAFRDYGIDMNTPAIARAAARIEQRAIRRELVAALDHWAVVRRNAGGRDASSILAVARYADPDNQRNRIRDYLERNDLQALLDASSSEEIAQLPPASAVVLADALSEQGSVDQAVMVLRTVHHANPGDLWINLLLAEDLHKLSKWDDMLHFAGIAHALRPASGAALLSIADALRHKGALQESVALCEEVIRLKADNPHAYEMLGLVREDQGDWDNAVPQFRRAIELHPTYVEAHNHLGRCLTRQGEIEAAIGALRRAIELKPEYAGPHENLGVALAGKRQFDEAIDELHKAIALDPNSAQAHTDLGVILVRRGQVIAGIEEHQRAIELNPDHAQAHSNLGNALRIRNEFDSAISEYREAIRLNPQLAAPNWNLAQTLMDRGNFAEAQVYFRHGQEVSLRDRYGRYPWAARLRECERMLELDGRLADVLAGNEQVANAEERTEYAMLCYSKRLFATGSRFYERAFAEEPKLAEDSGQLHLYRAACTAVLAGCGQSEDAGAPGLDDAERRRLRQLALDWLRADLAQHAKALESGDPKHRQPSLTQLHHWLVDPDLAGVRYEEALAKLPEAEQEPWRKLWVDVAELLTERSGQ